MANRDDDDVWGLEGLVPPGARVRRLASGNGWAEGIVYLPERNAIRWSDLPNDRILELDLEQDEPVVYAQPAGVTNGRTLDGEGAVIQCSHGRRGIERDVDGTTTLLVSEWSGGRFNSPNDVVVARDGAIWFTDPHYGLVFPPLPPGTSDYDDNFVFRYDPVSGDVRAAITEVEDPNGLAFSPDGSILYVADSSRLTSPTGAGNHRIRAFDVVGHRCKNARTFVEIVDGVPDGIRVDVHGNVWSSAADGVHVFAPDGRELGAIRVPENTSNLCFGGVSGQDLFVAAVTGIYTVPTFTTDAASVR